MPMYDLLCQRCDHEQPQLMTFCQFDKGRFPLHCSEPMIVKMNTPAIYGAMRIGDSDFRDAEEASGKKIESTKDIDNLEKAGAMYRITNPSRHRTIKG